MGEYGPEAASYAPTPMVGREPEQKHGLLPPDMKPLAINILADLLSTELMLHRGGQEDNPMPGMQHPAGRAGLGLAEMLITHYLTKGHPDARKAALTISSAVRGTLAGQNMTIEPDSSMTGRDDRKTVWNQRRY